MKLSFGLKNNVRSCSNLISNGLIFLQRRRRRRIWIIKGGLEVLSGSIFLLQEYAYERRILVPLISFEGPFRKWIECGMQQKPSHILTVVLQNWEKRYCNEEKTVCCSTITLYHFFFYLI